MLFSQSHVYSSPFMLLSEGVVLLENPKGDDILDVERLKTVCCSVFGLNGAPLTIFSGKTGEKHHLQTQNLPEWITSGTDMGFRMTNILIYRIQMQSVVQKSEMTLKIN